MEKARRYFGEAAKFDDAKTPDGKWTIGQKATHELNRLDNLPNLKVGGTAPEIDAKEEVMTEVEKLRDELKAIQSARETEATQRDADKKTADFADSWSKQKQKLMRSGYTDDGVAAVEKLAEERGIPDLEAAAALFEKLNPPAEPAHPAEHPAEHPAPAHPPEHH